MENKTQKEIENEMNDLGDEFSKFLHTKGISAKFKLAFADMEQSAKEQSEKNRAQFEQIKAQSAEQNKDFIEFIHTKGIKAKYRLVIENIKRGTAEAKQRNAESAANAAAARENSYHENEKPSSRQISQAFNEFLKEKGLDGEYTVIACGEDDN